MKHIQILAISLLLSPHLINAQTKLTPENPVAYQYLLKHFGLKGKVKTIQYYSSGNTPSREEQFDQEGRIISSINYAGTPSRYTYEYDNTKGLIRISYQLGNIPEITYLYQINSQKEVEYKLYKPGDPLRKFEYKGSLLIKDSSANRYSSQKEYYKYYEYNSSGQVVKQKDFNANDQLTDELTYVYGTYMVAVIAKKYPEGKGAVINNYEKTNYFDENGNLLKSVYQVSGRQEITEYKLDNQGNWIWKSGNTTRKITYYDNSEPGIVRNFVAEGNEKTPPLLAENPVSIRYLLKHEGLKGNVKKVTVKDSTGKIIRQTGYDPKGRLIRELTGNDRFAVSDHFNYDTAARSIVQRKEYATGEKFVYKYIYDKNGGVTQYYTGNQEGNFFYYQRFYLYRDSLLLTDTAYNPGVSDYMIQYQYNNYGQVVNEKKFAQRTRMLFEEINYEYKMQDGLYVVVLQRRKDYSGKGRYENSTTIRYYDNNQCLIKEQNPGSTSFSVNPRELIYKLDANGNWISNSKKETREIEYYPAGTPVQKAPANTVSQPALLLDENFDNNNNKWSVWDNEGSAAQLSDGYYKVNIRQNNNYATWLGLPVFAAGQSGDFAIETKIYLHSTETGHPFDSYWLLWGIGDNGKDFYAFGIYPEGKFQYGKMLNNSWNGLAGTMNSAYINTGIGKSNILRLEKRDTAILFFINGQKVYQAKYEIFNPANAGVGFQFNNKKRVDIDYLKITRVPGQVKLPVKDPYETAYQKDLERANDSKARAGFLANYLNGLFLKTDSLQFSELLREKLQQMAEIDFYAISEMLSSNKGPNEYRIRMQVMKQLPADQRQIIQAYAQCIVDNYQLRQQNQPEKSCPPAHLPQPGFGLGKKVSSDKPGVASVPNNGNNSQPPAIKNNPPTDPLSVLRQKAGLLQGQKIYVVKDKTTYFLPEKISINNLSDRVTLTAIGSVFTYSHSAGRNVFGIRKINGNTRELRMADIVQGIDNASLYYLVTEMGPCTGCGGGGGSWNSSTQSRSYCNHCGATGCVPTYIWNNGSSRAF